MNGQFRRQVKTEEATSCGLSENRFQTINSKFPAFSLRFLINCAQIIMLGDSKPFC